MCSSEITFKTDPKNADYNMEHGATRNFENWSEADPTGSRSALPDAAADDEYDSEGNPIEDRAAKDAMADLERSQEQSRREMELMDELADLRQRNARVELNNVDADTLLAQLHVERENAEEEARKRLEQEEDDALVSQYFSKIPSGPTVVPNGKGKGKEKEKAPRPIAPPGLTSIEEDGSQSGNEGADEGDGKPDNGRRDSGSESGSEGGLALPALTIKRRPPPTAAGATNGNAEPSVASILAARGKTLENGGTEGTGGPGSIAQITAAAAKRKREGMQKLLGIKKKK